MPVVLEQVPLQTIIVVPFPPLPDFPTHEQHFFAGMPPHMSIECPQVGEPLPIVARHLVQERFFPMDDFIVGKHKNKVFGEGIHEPKGHLVLVILAMDGILLKIFQRIVHPAHIPFQ